MSTSSTNGQQYKTYLNKASAIRTLLQQFNDDLTWKVYVSDPLPSQSDIKLWLDQCNHFSCMGATVATAYLRGMNLCDYKFIDAHASTHCHTGVWGVQLCTDPPASRIIYAKLKHQIHWKLCKCKYIFNATAVTFYLSIFMQICF